MSDQDYQIRCAQWPADDTLIQSVRRQVFVIEQGIPEVLEWDGLDPGCVHLLATSDGHPIGTIRLQSDGHIGRMAVLSTYRHQGIGTALMKSMLDIAAEQGLPDLYLDSQTAAIDFYKRFGFMPQGPEFSEAGIPHQRMIYSVQLATKTVD